MKLITTATAALAVLLSSAPAAYAVNQRAMFACMDAQQTLPPASRASICACYVEKAGSWSVRLAHLISSKAIVYASRRSMLGECLSADYAEQSQPRKPL